MGKLHRIKKRFQRITSQDPIPIGYHSVRYDDFRIGKTYRGGIYIYHYGRRYGGLFKRLIAEYESKHPG